MLLLTITLTCSVGIGTVTAGELLNIRLDKGDKVPFDATCYNEAADARINLSLKQRDEYRDGLEKCGDRLNRDWVVFGAGGFLLGVVTAVLISK